MSGLSAVEARLVGAAGAGDELDLRGTEDREIRAAVLRDVLVGPVDPRGLRLRGATVVGRLDLDGLRIPCRVRLKDCVLADGIWLRGGQLPMLQLSGSTVGRLLADDLVVDGSMLLRRVVGTGLVGLAGARVSGRLDLTSVRLDSEGIALLADRVVVGGDLLLDDAEVAGRSPAGALQLGGARVAGRLSARRLRVTNRAGPALAAANLQVTDTLDLSRGSVLHGAGKDGAVRLVGARIGSLSLGGAELANPDGWALAAHYLDVSGTVYLDRVRATGGLRLSGGRIGGQLTLEAAVVDGGADPALAGTRLHVAQAVVLDEAVLSSAGDRPTVDLRSARIAGDLELRRTRIAHPSGTALRLNTAVVDGRAILSEAEIESGALDLRDSTVGTLYDDPARVRGEVEANGLVYRGLPGHPGVTLGQRLAWLGRMPAYAAQPYRQLAAAYQAAGHEDDARKVLVSQQQRLHGGLTGWTSLRHRLFGLFLQYGYQPLRAVALLAAVLLVSIGLFLGLAGGTRTEAGAACPAVDRVGLAIDAAIPLVKTGADDRCKLATGTGAGQGLAAAGWVLTLLGWGSATLVVAGYSGLVRRR
ncbi:MAG TPA: hypothetical protein VLM05_04775 [Mycobacteriales bacterium]|nr:hypothetical protein [Mycobacteriales bacterium]